MRQEPILVVDLGKINNGQKVGNAGYICFDLFNTAIYGQREEQRLTGGWIQGDHVGSNQIRYDFTHPHSSLRPFWFFSFFTFFYFLLTFLRIAHH